ncbi:hypothetical protein CYLTODRAFT_331787, partial [Cylindrobasidium torrendii FP15055 ss-10]
LADKARPSLVPHNELVHSFWTRMNGSRAGTAHFDMAALEQDTVDADGIPTTTTQEDGGDELTRRMAEEEMQKGKQKLHNRLGRSAVGQDRVSYDDVVRIPNSTLVELFNDYRIIGLESCVLKLFTLIIEMRLTEWVDRKGLVPESQNGFRRGMRTHNCSFVLRTAIDAATADGKRVFVAFVDLKDAFPSTNIATLWTKMYRAGAAGPIFD